MVPVMHAGAEPLNMMAREIRKLDSGVRVELAFLEFMSPSLPEVALSLHQAGITEARLLPVFLGGAGHVLRDLPGLIETCKANCAGLDITELQPVGQQAPVIGRHRPGCGRLALGRG